MRKLMPSRSMIDLLICKVRQEFVKIDMLYNKNHWSRTKTLSHVASKKPRLIRELIDKELMKMEDNIREEPTKQLEACILFTRCAAKAIEKIEK